MKPFIRIAIFIIVVLLMFSCSGTSPVIDDIQWRILYRDDGQNRYEELSMFVRVSDPDGSEDPALITVSAGTTGLENSIEMLVNRSVTPDGITSLTSTSFSEVRGVEAPMLSNNAARTPVRIYLDDLPEGLSLYRESVVTVRIVCRIIAVSSDRQHMHLMFGSI